MKQNIGAVVSHGLVRAATKKMSLGLAGATATGALLFQSWELFAASMVGYCALVAWDLSRVGFWKQTLREVRRRPPEIPNALEFRDDVARDFIHRITASRAERCRVLEARQPALPERVTNQLETLVQIEARALALVGRMEDLSRFLSDKNLSGLRDDRLRLERAAETAPTGRLRSEYRKACLALDHELAAVDEIMAAREVLGAKLEVAVRTVEMFPAQVARLRAAEADSMDEPQELDLDPRSLIVDLRTVDELLARPEPLPSAALGEHGRREIESAPRMFNRLSR
jgi:hypothetical protein